MDAMLQSCSMMADRRTIHPIPAIPLKDSNKFPGFIQVSIFQAAPLESRQYLPAVRRSNFRGLELQLQAPLLI